MVTVTKSKHKHHSFSIDIRDICHDKINCQKFKPKTDGATWKAGFGSYGLHGLVLRIYVTVICYSYREKIYNQITNAFCKNGDYYRIPIFNKAANSYALTMGT